MKCTFDIADGLTYTCNTNTDNGIDFCVLKDNGSGDIRTVQGSPSLSAGNTFGGSVYHFYNDGESTVAYYYDGTVPSRIPNTSLLYWVSANLNTNPNITTNACAEHGGPVVKSAEEKKALAEEYAAARKEYDRLLELLKKTDPKSADYEAIAAMAVEQHHAWHLAAGDIVRSNLMDTVADPEELKTWLSVLEEGATPKDRAQGGGRSMTYGCPTLPTGTRGLDKPADTKVSEENKVVPHVTVSPNPANTWLNVDYDLPEGNDKAVLVITSAIGTKMAELTLEGHRGSKTIDIRALPAGVYFLSVTIDNGEQYVTKVVRQ